MVSLDHPRHDGFDRMEVCEHVDVHAQGDGRGRRIQKFLSGHNTRVVDQDVDLPVLLLNQLHDFRGRRFSREVGLVAADNLLLLGTLRADVVLGRAQGRFVDINDDDLGGTKAGKSMRGSF